MTFWRSLTRCRNHIVLSSYLCLDTIPLFQPRRTFKSYHCSEKSFLSLIYFCKPWHADKHSCENCGNDIHQSSNNIMKTFQNEFITHLEKYEFATCSFVFGLVWSDEACRRQDISQCPRWWSCRCWRRDWSWNVKCFSSDRCKVSFSKSQIFLRNSVFDTLTGAECRNEDRF